MEFIHFIQVIWFIGLKSFIVPYDYFNAQKIYNNGPSLIPDIGNLYLIFLDQSHQKLIYFIFFSKNQLLILLVFFIVY